MRKQKLGEMQTKWAQTIWWSGRWMVLFIDDKPHHGQLLTTPYFIYSTIDYALHGSGIVLDNWYYLALKAWKKNSNRE